jgi:hypothetical protein
MAKKRLKIKDRQGNAVDYDVSSSSVTLDGEGGKSLDNKLDELEEADATKASSVTFNGTEHTSNKGNVDVGNQMQADWGESNPNYPSYIKNKPTIPAGVEVDPAMSDTSEHAVQNKVIKAYVDQAVTALQNALNALTQNSDSQNIINTFNEIVAYLDGIKTNDPTLTNTIAGLQQSITALQTAIAGKISGIKEHGASNPITPDENGIVELPQQSASVDTYNGLDCTEAGKALDARQGKGLKDLIDALQIVVNRKADSSDIPANISDLVNDSGFITAAALAGVVAGSADFAMTYDSATDTYDIIRIVPTITIADIAEFTQASSQKTVNIKGVHLKGNITLTVPSGWSASKTTFVPSDGEVDEDITLSYTGSATAATGTLVAESSGAESVSKALLYSQYGNTPTIILGESSMTFEAIGGQTQTKNVSVSKFNLTAAIQVAVSGTNSGKFTASLNAAEDTLTIVYQPAAGDSGTQTATITLTSGTASASVNVSGTALVPSLTVDKNSLSFTGAVNTETAAQDIKVTGENLLNDVSITAPNGFSVTDANGNAISTLDKDDVMSTNGVTIKVKAAGTNTNATLTLTCGSLTKSISLIWEEVVVETEGTGDIVLRGVGYPNNDYTGTPIKVKFKITQPYASGTNGKVSVIRSDEATAYTGSVSYSGMKSVEIPESITINEHTYDVTEIAGGAFANNTVFEYIKFTGTSKVKTFSSTTNLNFPPFYGCSNFKGTSTADDVNIFEFPPATTTLCSVEGAKVKKVIVGNTFSGNLVDFGWNVTIVDAGTGTTGLHNNWYKRPNLISLTFRKNAIARLQDYTVTQWIANRTSASPLQVYVPSDKVSAYEASETSEYKWKDLVDAGKAEINAIS